MQPMDPFAQPRRPNWLVDGIWMKGKINGLFGAEKAGKSRLVSYILTHMYQEVPVFGKFTQAPRRMLYLCGEEQPEDVAGRLRQYHEVLGMDFDKINWPERITFCNAAGMRLEQREQREWLQEEIISGGYDMLLADPLRRIHGASENSNDEMAPLLNWLRKITNEGDLTVCIFHHTGGLGEDDDESRIATWSRGATDLPAILDWAVYMRRYKQGSRVDLVKVRAQGRAPDPAMLRLHDYGDDHQPPWVLGSGGKDNDG